MEHQKSDVSLPLEVKQRIEKEAEKYADRHTAYISRIGLRWVEARNHYIAGAESEHLRVQAEINELKSQARKDFKRINELEDLIIENGLNGPGF